MYWWTKTQQALFENKKLKLYLLVGKTNQPQQYKPDSFYKWQTTQHRYGSYVSQGRNLGPGLGQT